MEWNGARDSSVIYSPVSGFAILPPCIAKNIGDTVVCDIDYGMIFTYGHPNCGTVRVVKDGPNNHEECPGVGDFVEYDAIPLEGGEVRLLFRFNIQPISFSGQVGRYQCPFHWPSSRDCSQLLDQRASTQGQSRRQSCRCSWI